MRDPEGFCAAAEKARERGVPVVAIKTARTALSKRMAVSHSGALAGDDAVRAMGGAWRAMVAEHPGLYAATDRYPCSSDAELAAAVERVVQMLGQALAGYGLADDERIHAARTLRSAFHGFAHLEAGDGHPFALDLDDSFDRMVVLLCAGIRQMATVSA